MKTIFKNILVGILGWQVKRLYKKHNFKTIGIVGSIGKTSTKLAIAKVLESDKRVRYQKGNYNDIVSVPLIFFGQKMPTLFNALAWFGIIIKNEFQITSNFPFDIVVVELGTDAPGQIIKFKKYLLLDIAVVTAVTPEHMEFFKTLEAVMVEEWNVRFFSKKIFANRDLCQILPLDLNSNQVKFYSKLDQNYRLKTFSQAENYSASAAVSVAKYLKISKEKISKALNEISNFAGRMQKLKGIKNSIIIDDSYNSSPQALKMALDAIYAFETSQRIAILGMMNELGEMSESEHRKVGEYCKPELLDWVITIGRDANAFLALAARSQGCQVYESRDALDAGNFAKEKIREKAVVLVKGSQNGVFTEEAIKPLLANRADISKLVRQDKKWMDKKNKG
ncbi:MAG: hypothetical protein JW740_03315 [Candidatus Zambryskibacteria bacterium]|nr:hypothetical protein [Candidatus Zambryskibacteria bacterium]